MSGLIGKKLGMTSFFDNNGRTMGCTVIEAGPCVVTQIKDIKTDGYKAIQLSYDDMKDKKMNASLSGHFKRFKSFVRETIVFYIHNFENLKKTMEQFNLFMFGPAWPQT